MPHDNMFCQVIFCDNMKNLQLVYMEDFYVGEKK
jgi:hypothetical protein